jgi:hypothetical protein
METRVKEAFGAQRASPRENPSREWRSGDSIRFPVFQEFPEAA